TPATLTPKVELGARLRPTTSIFPCIFLPTRWTDTTANPCAFLSATVGWSACLTDRAAASVGTNAPSASIVSTAKASGTRGIQSSSVGLLLARSVDLPGDTAPRAPLSPYLRIKACTATPAAPAIPHRRDRVLAKSSDATFPR